MLKHCIELSCSVKVYVPSTLNVNLPVDNEVYIDSTLELMSKLFGGATSSKGIGCWISASSELVKEQVTIVFSYCKESDLQTHLDEIYEHCMFLKSEMGQEAIALEVNNKLYLV